jgi:hypothetical protein
MGGGTPTNIAEFSINSFSWVSCYWEGIMSDIIVLMSVVVIAFHVR